MRTIDVFYPRKLVFGSEAWDTLAADLRSLGFQRVFLISIEPLSACLRGLSDQLVSSGATCEFDFSIVNEPTFAEFEELLGKVRAFDADCVVGVGGGSVMDVAKLLAAQQKNTQSTDEIVGIGNLAERQTHLICVPSTSGTGSEVSPNALFTSDNGAKVGVISPYLVPDAAYVYPELTCSVPPSLTAATGIDALTHCLEAYANKFAHPMMDTLALEGVRLIAENLLMACRDGNNIEVRSKVALGSLYGGMCLGPVNTGAVHALAYPLGTQFHIPHGLSNALLLPYVMEFNLSKAVEPYAAIGRAMAENGRAGESDEHCARFAIEKIRELISDCEIPSSLSAVDIPEEAIDGLAEDAIQVQRLLKNNLREVSLNDAKSMYRAAL